jgi:hypothetical protein
MTITGEELEFQKKVLCKWQRPTEFVRVVDELMSKIGSFQFFTDSKAAFGRDAWVASKLASVCCADAVRLGPDRWPDFEMRADGVVQQYEIKEADLPGRRRGDEYRATGPTGSSQWKMGPVEDWAARAAQAPDAIRRAAIRKTKKGYSPSAWLIIYLNISEHGIRQQEIETAMAESTAPAKDAFRHVWLLWKSGLYLLWSGGEREMLMVPLNGLDA